MMLDFKFKLPVMQTVPVAWGLSSSCQCQWTRTASASASGRSSRRRRAGDGLGQPELGRRLASQDPFRPVHGRRARPKSP